MSDFAAKVLEIIECPVCRNIPRDLPVDACGAGHVVCKQCRKEMTKCPSCRGRLLHTNTIVGHIALIAKHKCSFHIFGQCKYTDNIEEIKEHEKSCLERTVTCPYKDCNKDVQLKQYKDHALRAECAIDLYNIDAYEFYAGRLPVQFNNFQLYCRD